MRVIVYRLSGGYLESSDWEFTFHGLRLEEQAEQFMDEKSHLTCTAKTSIKKICYIPFHDISKIEVTE